jgi:hypothetical protein
MKTTPFFQDLYRAHARHKDDEKGQHDDEQEKPQHNTTPHVS